MYNSKTGSLGALIPLGPKMQLAEMAAHYLADSPRVWYDFSQRLSGHVSEWVSDKAEESPYFHIEDLDRLNTEFLSEFVLATLLRVDTVKEMAFAKDTESGPNLADLLRRVLCAQFRIDPEYYWETGSQILSGFSDDQEGRDWEGWPRPWFPPISETADSYTIERLLDPAEILDLIEKSHRRTISKQTQQLILSPDELTPSLVRLDAVDLALYRALATHPELLKTLDWRLFEKLLADLLERLGYEVELQRGTKDGGIDLFAVMKSGTFGPQRYLLQAKRWSNKVDVEPVRQLAFLHTHYKMTKSCLATTATFTRGAWELADQYRWQLELRDFSGLQQWIAGVIDLRGQSSRTPKP
jgi:HJR/Mrr/RecB family endonuclease